MTTVMNRDPRRRMRLFTRDEYHRMREAGVLGEDDRIELIEGKIVKMAAIGSRHAGCVNKFTYHLAQLAVGKAIVSVQNPIALSDASEPEPDIVLLRLRDDFYEASHPAPEDALLLIEVADSSVADDRQVKLPLYAQAGIAEVWLVNLEENELERYTQPSDSRYRQMSTFTREDTLSPTLLPEVKLELNLILGQGEDKKADPSLRSG